MSALVHVRDAAEGDLPEMVAIYNDVVVNTTALWNDDTVDVGNRAAWLAERRARGFPVLVAVLAGADPGAPPGGGEPAASAPGEPTAPGAGAIAGYASFGDFRAWDGYRNTVEGSIYVRADLRGRGVGSVLLPALIDRAEALGKHVMIAGIERSNEASLRLHERFGFRPGGVLHEVGFKFGRWLDLVFLQRPLAAGR